MGGKKGSVRGIEGERKERREGAWKEGKEERKKKGREEEREREKGREKGSNEGRKVSRLCDPRWVSFEWFSFK